jgi:hypothetical protein
MSAVQCPSCARPAIVMLTRVVVIGKRKVAWQECARCWVRAERGE